MKAVTGSRLIFTGRSGYRFLKVSALVVALLAVGVVGKSALSHRDGTQPSAQSPVDVSARPEVESPAPGVVIREPAVDTASALNPRRVPFPPTPPGLFAMQGVPATPTVGPGVKAKSPKPIAVPDHQIAAARLVPGPQETWQAPAPVEHPVSGQQPASLQNPGDVNGDRPPRELPLK